MGGVEVVLAVGGVVALVAIVVAVFVLRASRRRALAERRALEEGLRTSREQVEQLAQRVEELSAEVQGARRTSAAAAADREYVITTLAEVAQTTGGDSGVGAPAQRPGMPVDVEERVVESLARVDDRTVVGRRVVDLGVSLLASAHGVRRALRQEHLDRAAAEAHVARRRSRRLRRQELREAKRLLRAVRERSEQSSTGVEVPRPSATSGACGASGAKGGAGAA